MMTFGHNCLVIPARLNFGPSRKPKVGILPTLPRAMMGEITHPTARDRSVNSWVGILSPDCDCTDLIIIRLDSECRFLVVF